MVKRHVLVTGATGQQGGAVARERLKSGHQVRALTRRASSDAANALQEKGAEIVVGDMNDSNSLKQAASGVDTAFIMTTPFEAGVEGETEQGIAIVDAVVDAGVEHVVFSSVGSADQQTGIPHFDSKYKVEKHLQRLDRPWTIVAPVFFMDNILAPWNLTDLKNGVFRQALPSDRKLQLISVRDIGRINAHVIEERDPFIGRRIDVASDELTGPEIANVLSEASGRSISYVEQPMEEVRAQSEDMAAMLEWFDRIGFSADIDGLRRDYPEVGWITFEQWAQSQDRSLLG